MSKTLTLQPQHTGRDRYVRTKSTVKFKMPMPNVFSVVVKEENTGMLQLMSQGTADLILDVCSDYWNGQDLCPLTEADRYVLCYLTGSLLPQW